MLRSKQVIYWPPLVTRDEEKECSLLDYIYLVTENQFN
jgi:hypothetical protein